MPRPKTPKKSSILSTTQRQHLTHLRSFLEYFGRTVYDKSHGRYVARHHGVIFWPDFGEAARRSTAWLRSFWSHSAQQKARRAAAIPPSGPAYRAWHTKTLRRRLEALLAPLLLSPTTPAADAWSMYAPLQDGYAPPDPDLCSEQRRALLRDPANYTVFRRPNFKEQTLIRLLVPPPTLQSYLDHEHDLPEEIACLYRAWHTLQQRTKTPFDPMEVGLEWTDAGLVFVNWRRFLSSTFAPPDKLPPDEVAGRLQGGRARGGNYSLRLSAFPPPEEYRTMMDTLKLVEMSFGDYADPCTVFDPAYLHERSNIFEAPYHQERQAKAARRKALTVAKAEQRRKARALGEDIETGRTVRVYPYNYTPYEHVPYAFSVSEKPCHFPPECHEVTYAIEYRGQLYFRPPTLRPITAESPACEVEAWRKALATWRIVERFTETGEIGDVSFQPHGEVVNETLKQELEAVALQELENYTSYDKLSATEIKKLRERARQKYGEDPTTASAGGQWYYDKVRAVARKRLPLTAVCRQAKVIIPHIVDEETGKPRVIKGKFFSRMAIKHVQQVSKDAPYLYAWATFCGRVMARGVLPSLTEDFAPKSSRWTPREDFILLEHYRAHPRMSSDEKASLLKKLERHDWDAAVRRVLQINKMLKLVLTKTQLDRYTVGKMWFPDTPTAEERRIERLRLLVVIGVATRAKYLGEKLTTRLPLVERAWQLDPDFLAEVTLPPYYRTERFEWIAKGEAVN